MIEHRICEYGGWDKCLELRRGDMELVVTLDVGPRIIRFGARGRPNLFHEFPEQLGKRSGDQWCCFGGHRLWHAPEVFPRTYAPDFDPVVHSWHGDSLRLVQETEASTGIQKQITIELSDDHVRLEHRLTNRNVWAVELAPWCLSVMASGGRAILPQEPYFPHPDVLTPARPLVLWHFTRMNDPRFTWGDRLITVREDASCPSKQKFGARNGQGWAAYELGEQLFIKTFSLLPGKRYPDDGCNCEIYTEPGFLEVETLGPLARLEPGESVDHVEHWQVWSGVRLPNAEPELVHALEPFLAQLKRPTT